MNEPISRGRQYENGPIESGLRWRVNGQPHRCGAACTCPIHGTPLIYWPAGDDHACQDVDCRFGHGVRAVAAGR